MRLTEVENCEQKGRNDALSATFTANTEVLGELATGLEVIPAMEMKKETTNDMPFIPLITIG